MRGRTKCNQPTPVLITLLQLTGIGLITILLSACGSGSAAPASDINNANTAGFGDADIASALYFDQRTPASFYHEIHDAASYVSVSHIKNTDLVVAANRDAMPAYELSTDSADEALAWSEQAAGLLPAYRQLVDSSDSFMYFQFTRVDPATPQFVVQNRVFKASVIDRSGVNESYLGRVTQSDIRADQVKQMIEYLWLFSNDNNYGNAVLTSSTTETRDAFEHVMQVAKLAPSYGAGCDTIEVYEDRYRIAKDSGFIRKQSALVRVLTARRDGGSILLCQ